MTALPDNLDTLEARIAKALHNSADWYDGKTREPAFAALTEMVAEVKRLREIVALDGAHERAMTVAFLRDFAQYTNTAEAEGEVLRAADRIARGEHRTEEKIP
jgi:hypothetical protein